MQKDIQTRTASCDDIDALLDLYAFLSPGDERPHPDVAKENLRKISQIAGSAVLLGLLEDMVLTTCTLIVIPNLTKAGRPYALIENMVTHPDARGRGLGGHVLNAACDRAWLNGCYKVMLSTGSTRRSTLSFYEGAGFEQSRTGFQKRRLPKRVE